MVKNGLSQRDIDLLLFINEFGKSYAEVLHKCFFSETSLQVTKNRISVLKNKYKLLKHTPTGAITPKYYISLSEQGKKFVFEELGEDAKSCFFALSTLQHNIYEQLTYYALLRAGKEPKRAKVVNWSKTHHHTPDLVYMNGDKMVYVEIEISRKSQEVYNSIFEKVLKDGVSNIIYLAKDEKWKKKFLEVLPKWDGLRVADIENFFNNALKDGKIVAEKQQIK